MTKLVSKPQEVRPMKKVLIAAVVVAICLCWLADYGRAQTDDLQGGIFWAPNSARKVTLTRNGAVLASIEIPD